MSDVNGYIHALPIQGQDLFTAHGHGIRHSSPQSISSADHYQLSKAKMRSSARQFDKLGASPDLSGGSRFDRFSLIRADAFFVAAPESSLALTVEISKATLLHCI